MYVQRWEEDEDGEEEREKDWSGDETKNHVSRSTWFVCVRNLLGCIWRAVWGTGCRMQGVWCRVQGVRAVGALDHNHGGSKPETLKRWITIMGAANPKP